MLEIFPSLSMIKIADYLNKVTNVLNKVFIAVIVISTVTIVIGLIVISSAIMVQGKVREYQNLVFKILGFSRKEIIFSSLIEFMIIFISVIMIAIFFAVIGSKFIIENIFELSWKFNLEVLIYLGLSIGFVTLVLILLTNIKYLNPKVYPLIRNQQSFTTIEFFALAINYLLLKNKFYHFLDVLVYLLIFQFFFEK